MAKHSKPSFLLLGEAVVDLISTGIAISLEDASDFHRYAGGQVSNLATNLSRLGYDSRLGACVGDDSFGRYFQLRLSEAGVNLDLIQTSPTAPTTLIPIARQTDTPDFIVYRGADSHLTFNDELVSAVDEVQAVHTSAFALSRDPCRTTVLDLIDQAKKAEKLISLDPNYHPGIWPDFPDYRSFLAKVYPLITVTKPSLDDSKRFFGPGYEPGEYLEKYLELGPKIVVLTLGSQGAILGTQEGDRFIIKANDVPVMDVTGAGDAYWTGLLSGLVEGLSPRESAQRGQAIAEYKIGILGPIKHYLSLDQFNERAKLVNIETLE
jgi:fructokinase